MLLDYSEPYSLTCKMSLPPLLGWLLKIEESAGMSLAEQTILTQIPLIHNRIFCPCYFKFKL